MSLLIGRITIEDPESWPEQVGNAANRVGGVPTPGERAGVTISAGLTLAPDDAVAKADRQRVRRQFRALLNNPLARLQGVWVAWTEDAEQDGWYVPGQATIDMEPGSLVSGFFRVQGAALDLVGRPRTHRRAMLARRRDLRLAAEPKDTLKRLYGATFDGSGSIGTDVTPAPQHYLPSTVTDLVAHSGGTPALGTAIAGRSSTSVTPVTGLSDLAVVSFEQAAAARLLGDVVVYDRRAEVGTPPTTGPHASWEEVHGRDWPWTGRVVIDNYTARLHLDGSGVIACEYWSGAAFTEYAAVVLKARISSTDYALDTVLSTTVHEWTPERGVVHLRMSNGATAGTTCDVYLTMQRGWLGPRFEVYPASGQVAKVSIDPTGTIGANTVPTTFTASVNSGAITATHGVPVAVVQHAATSATVSGAVEVAGTGYVSAHISRCATGDVATAHPALGADVLAGTTYPHTVVPR